MARRIVCETWISPQEEAIKNPGNCGTTKRSKACIHQLAKNNANDMPIPTAPEAITVFLKLSTILSS
jgi:hypothetical protein